MKNKPLFRAVFDCMIYLQGVARTKNPANACFALVKENIVELYLSREMLAEIEEVLARPKFRNRFTDIDRRNDRSVSQRRKRQSRHLENRAFGFQLLRDPKDEKYVNLAVKAKVDYIVSRDNDLLDLMTGYTDECKDFRRRFRGLQIVNPLGFLVIVVNCSSRISFIIIIFNAMLN